MREPIRQEKNKLVPSPNTIVRREPIIDYLADNYSDHAGLPTVALKVKAMLERHVKVTPDLIDYLFQEALQDKVTQNIAERKKMRAKRQDNRQRQGYTYFIRNGDRIKIGFSRNPKARAESLSLRESNILGVIESGQQFERMMHDNWAHIRIGNTEWFQATDELMEFINNTASKWHYRHTTREPKRQSIEQAYINLARKMTGEI
jgi:hypothetical protein